MILGLGIQVCYLQIQLQVVVNSVLTTLLVIASFQLIQTLLFTLSIRIHSYSQVRSIVIPDSNSQILGLSFQNRSSLNSDLEIWPYITSIRSQALNSGNRVKPYLSSVQASLASLTSFRLVKFYYKNSNISTTSRNRSYKSAPYLMCRQL